MITKCQDKFPIISLACVHVHGEVERGPHEVMIKGQAVPLTELHVHVFNVIVFQ